MSSPTALITGGTSGIGRATALLLHERGYRLMVTGSTEASVAAARAVLPADLVVVRADSRLPQDAQHVRAEVAERFGTLDALFLNAGISVSQPAETVDEATYDQVFATNTKGTFVLLQQCLPLLADGAAIVFTVGIGATHGIPGGSVTAASRGALLAMVPSLALELAPRQIRVNAVSPGAIDTPIWARSGLPADTLAEVLSSISTRNPLGRLGQPQEVAGTVAFLLSDSARYITGQNIVIDGGASLSA
jgi:NAD(P)-dependent dehydrogenase (short-subunit alcohol dehydrogenase family)